MRNPSKYKNEMNFMKSGGKKELSIANMCREVTRGTILSLLIT